MCYLTVAVFQCIVKSAKCLLKCLKRRPIVACLLILLAPVAVNTVYVSAYIVWSFSPDTETGAQAKLDNAIWKAQLRNRPVTIPRIIHQIWIGKDGKPLPDRMVGCAASWSSLRCCEYRMWNESSATEFLQKHFPWHLALWRSYYYTTNRVDALKYLIMFHYGGLYIDTDICNKQHPDPIDMLTRKYLTNNAEVAFQSGIPTGINPEIIMSPPHHPFLKHCISGLAYSFKRYILGYLHAMFVGGPLFVSGRYSKYPSELARTQIKLMPYVESRQVDFSNVIGGSWATWDSDLIINIIYMGVIKGHENWRVIVLIWLLTVFGCLLLLVLLRRRIAAALSPLLKFCCLAVATLAARCHSRLVPRGWTSGR